MTENKKITRRDAIKLLGAVTGATVLANLPSRWSTPQIASGVLPAHAQTSTCYSARIETLTVASGGIINAALISGPSSDEDTWTGLPDGTYVAWYCQTGCLQLSLNSGTTGSIQVTTRTNDFVLNFDGITLSQDVLIDLGTGDYALNFVSSVGSCTWTD